MCLQYGKLPPLATAPMKVGYARLSVGDPEGLTLAIQTQRLQAAGC